MVLRQHLGKRIESEWVDLFFLGNIKYKNFTLLFSISVQDLLPKLISFLVKVQSSILIFACMHQGSIYYHTKWLRITKNLKGNCQTLSVVLCTTGQQMSKIFWRNSHSILKCVSVFTWRHPNVLDIETNIHKLVIDKMESDNVQHENELAELATNNETENIPLNQEHLLKAKGT